MKKAYDLAVKTGEYTNRQGETKGRWQNVGAVMEKEDGGRFIMLDRTFNPAGVPNPDNRATILVSMFEPRDYGDQQPNRSSSPPAPAPAPRQAPQQAPFEPDDIPF